MNATASPSRPDLLLLYARAGEAGMPCCIPLVIRARMNGKLKDIEFDFNLETDDAQQVRPTRLPCPLVATFRQT